MIDRKRFAPDNERDGNMIVLPRDIEWRREVFGPDVMKHPAKMQMYIVKYAVEYYREMGLLNDTSVILDPFGGTGTTGLAATYGYRTELIELEPIYLDLLRSIRNTWSVSEFDHFRDAGRRLMVLAGDCRQVLEKMAEDSVDLIITSPPYSVNAQVGKEVTEFTGILAERKAQMREYGSSGASPLNIGRLNSFNFEQAMKKVYSACLRVMKPGGVYLSVTKDTMQAGSRQLLSSGIIRSAQSSGLKFEGEWWKWKAPGGMLQNVQKSKGLEVVPDEDIIAFKTGVTGNREEQAMSEQWRLHEGGRQFSKNGVGYESIINQDNIEVARVWMPDVAERIAKLPALETAAPTAAVSADIKTLIGLTGWKQDVHDPREPLCVTAVRAWLVQYQEGVSHE